jgi:heat shock protein HtpX
MYKQITENKLKTVVLVTGFFVFIIGLAWVLGYAFDVSWLLPVAVAISVVQALISYYSGDKIALAVSGAQPIAEKDNAYLYRMVENLAITAGLPMPAVYMIPDTAINAFATGRDPKHASIAVTAGAVERLANEELEGVLAHELAHIGNYDIRLSTITVVLVGTVALLSDLFMHHMWFGGNRDREENNNGLQPYIMILGIVLIVLAPIVASLIQLAVSRKREYLADATGALMTRYPEGLARALEKIGADHEPLETANKATAHMYFANPLKDYAGKINDLFSTHPPIADRVARLRNMT